jgi:dihydroorotate dehydrogenase
MAVMKEKILEIRDRISHFLYKKIAVKIFFLMDPEKIHDMMIIFGRMLGSNLVTRAITSQFFRYSNEKLQQKILGIEFPNPVGLGAGFDKNAQITSILPAVGFGFAEVGSITGEPCEGNPRPRLWRLKKSKSIVIYYGLKNDGCEKISARLAKKRFRIPIGTSVAKTNCKETVETDAGVADYVKVYRSFADIGSYTTINISCPNAFGGEPFTDPAKLEKLLKETDKITTKKPVFLKISPDLDKKEIDKIIEVSGKHRVDGFICSNLTKKRDNPKIIDEKVPEKGGMSGKVLDELADDLISYVYKKTKGKCVIIASGGVFNAEDAYRKIKLGATLVQVVTGMIFEGPQTISQINQGLVKLLEKDGFVNISEAVGKDNKL